MIRRLRVPWPHPAPFVRGREVVRVLAFSDADDPALFEAKNREELGRLDLLLGCGDLEPDYLAFLADAFPVPLLYVRGNHDFGAAWDAGSGRAPESLRPGCVAGIEGLRVAGLPWPGGDPFDRGLHALAAWRQALWVAWRARRRRDAPLIVISHMPPKGAGDDPSDRYHSGFRAYRWLADHLRPPLWLHGHTPLAAAIPWHSELDSTTFVNVTGAVLIELTPAGAASASRGGRDDGVAEPDEPPLLRAEPPETGRAA